MYYIVIPDCHGNGGWIGSTTAKKCRSLKQALATYPIEFNWNPIQNPYCTESILNAPRICKETKDPNFAAYVWNEWDNCWEEDDFPDGDPKK